MPEATKVQHILRGLEPNLMRAIYPFLDPQGDVRSLLRQARVHCQASAMADRHNVTPGPPLTFMTSDSKSQPGPSFVTQDELASALQKLKQEITGNFSAANTQLRTDIREDLRKELKVMGNSFGKRTADPQVAGDKSKRKRTTCHYCGRTGHIERFCFEKANKKQSETGNDTPTPSGSKTDAVPPKN